MTVSGKLIAAAALIAAGFGVAKLVGEPAARLSALQSGGEFASQPVAAAASKPANDPSIAPHSRSGPRLVPDFGTTNPYETQTAPTAGDIAPPLLPGKTSPDVTITQQIVTKESDAIGHSSYALRAKLRDEAPRPLAIEQRAPVSIQCMPPTAMANVAPANDAGPRSASVDWRAPGLMPADFPRNAGPASALTASYAETIGEGRSESFIAPPPWPSAAEADAPRTHIIVDGDSLEKLAGRYLDDPQRSDEIYELNRELLASPDLLPIGAELVLPARNTASAFDGGSPQSFVPRSITIRSATHSGVVPVRPIPSTSGVVPRAQLVRPLPVE